MPLSASIALSAAPKKSGPFTSYKSTSRGNSRLMCGWSSPTSCTDDTSAMRRMKRKAARIIPAVTATTMSKMTVSA